MFHGNRIDVSFAFLLSLALFAQSQSPSTNKSLGDLHWFSGRWSLDGKFIRSGKAISAELSFEPMLEERINELS